MSGVVHAIWALQPENRYEIKSFVPVQFYVIWYKNMLTWKLEISNFVRR
jgi:hypothetical protein